MKTRIISAIIVLSIFIPICIKGGLIFNLAFYVVGMLGLKEVLDVKEKKRKLPTFIKILIYLLFSAMYFVMSINEEMVLNIDFRIISGIFLVLLLPTVLYHDKKVYNVKDSFYLLGELIFLANSFYLFVMYRNISLVLFIYLFLVTILTDTFAYISGMLVGKHKLLKEISPNKTWEGLIIGSIMGTILCTIYYTAVIDSNISFVVIVPITLFLTIIGQFGDLFFSSIKRYCGVKDFSNLIPGHGGVLDRFDSIIFVMLVFTFFLTIL